MLADTLTKIRTDLALEARNMVTEENGKIKGIRVTEETIAGEDINIIKMDVLNKYGAEAIGKPVGTYITMETPNLSKEDDGYHSEISMALSEQLKMLITRAFHWNTETPSVLIAGLGNRDATPDSLGPKTVSNLMITRHIVEYMGYEEVEGAFAVTSAISPGVMAQTGIDTGEILQALIKKIKPDILVTVDALAARNASRLNSTIQITDTGIHPGSGVGNNRCAITKKTMGIPVIAIGVPTVVDATSMILDSLRDESGECNKVIPEYLKQFYVTSKDIDAIIKRVSYTLSEGINHCMGLAVKKGVVHIQ